MTRHPKNIIKVSSSAFESIPHDMVCEILGRVAASSITSIFNAKFSCKTLNAIAEDKHVYQRVSLEKIPVVPWNPLSEKQQIFLNRCRQHENSEMMYRQAVLDYFNGINPRSSCINLQKALKQGHIGALYVNCIILLLSGDANLKQKGIKMLANMQKSSALNRKLRSCRENLISILSEMWVKNPILTEPPICCTTRYQHQWKRGWSEEEEEDIKCEACMADKEIKFVCSKYNY